MKRLLHDGGWTKGVMRGARDIDVDNEVVVDDISLSPTVYVIVDVGNGSIDIVGVKWMCRKWQLRVKIGD